MANAGVFDAGYEQGFQRGEEPRLRKQALSEAEFQEKHNEIQGMIDNLNTKLATIPEEARNTPDYLKAKDALAQALQARYEHWKSLDHPNALMKFGKMLGKDLHFPQKAAPPVVNPPVYGQPTLDVDGEKLPTGAAYKVQGPQTPAQTKAAAEANQMAAAGPLSPEQQAQSDVNTGATKRLAEFNADMKFYDQQNPHAAGPDATPDEKQAREDYRNERIQFYGQGIKPIQPKETDEYWTDVKGSTPEEYPKGSGKYRIEQVNKRGQHQYRDLPEGYAPPAPKATKMTGPQLLQDSYLATLKLPSSTPWSTLTDAQRAGYQLYLNKLKLRSSNHQAAIVDRDGNVHLVDLSGSSGPADVSPSRSTPTSSAQGRSGATAKGAQPTVQDLVLNFKKATPDYTKARNTYNDAERIARLGDKWVQTPNSEADQNFVLSLIRSEAGRVNQQEIAMMFNAGGISEAPARWAAKVGHGELPPALRQQILDFVHIQRDAAKEVVDEMNTSGAGASQTGDTSLADRLSNALAGK